MSKSTNQTTAETPALDTVSFKSINDVLIDDSKRHQVWKRRRTLQQCLREHIEDLYVDKKVNGKKEKVEPLKTFQRCGYAMGGFRSVKVKVYGDRSEVHNLVSCGNRSCPYCYLSQNKKLSEQTEMSLIGASTNDYDLHMVTFTKEKIVQIEKSVAASRDWMDKFTALFKARCTNKGIKSASIINLEYTIGRHPQKDPSWNNQKVYKLHVHNHAILAIHKDNADEWKEMKKYIELNYVKFMKDLGIKTFPKGHKDRHGNPIESVHWDEWCNPTKGLAYYVHKMEREISPLTQEVISSQGKQAREGNFSLFQALDWFHTNIHQSERDAMRLTLARTMVAIHGQGKKIHKQYNFLYRSNAGSSNIGKMGFNMKKKLILKRLVEDGLPKPEHLKQHLTLHELQIQNPDYDWGPLNSLVAKAMAHPQRESLEDEIEWVVRLCQEIEDRCIRLSWRPMKHSPLRTWLRRMKEGKDEPVGGIQRMVDDVIDAAGCIKRIPSAKLKAKDLREFAGLVRFIAEIEKTQEIKHALRMLRFMFVENFSHQWKELDEEDVDPIGEMDVPAVVWDWMHAHGHAFDLVLAIQKAVRFDKGKELLQEQIDKSSLFSPEDRIVDPDEIQNLVAIIKD